MRARHALFAGMLLVAPAARAEERNARGHCDSVQVRVAPNLDARWRDAAAELSTELRQLAPQECAAISIAIERAPSGIAIHAHVADGREATRNVGDPKGLSAVVRGLLAVAPIVGADEADGAEAATPAPAPAEPPSPLELPPPETRDAPRLERPPSSTALTLGVASGVRAALPTNVAMLDLELRADVIVGDWFVLASLRHAPFGATPRMREGAYDETAIGLGVGRRLVAGRSTFDLALAPSVAFVTMDSSAPPSPAGGESFSEHAQLRVGASARWGYALSKSWRFTTTLDSELAPRALTHHHHEEPDGLAPLPGWTLGLRIGALASLL